MSERRALEPGQDLCRELRAGSAADLEGRAILVVEDDLRLAFEIERAIVDAGGLVVGPAATVPEALRLVNVERVDGAILDVLLHGEPATAVAEELSERGIPFVFHTDLPVRPPTAECFPETPVCLKPIPPHLLVEMFAKFLAARSRYDHWFPALAQGAADGSAAWRESGRLRGPADHPEIAS